MPAPTLDEWMNTSATDSGLPEGCVSVMVKRPAVSGCVTSTMVSIVLPSSSAMAIVKVLKIEPSS